MSTSKVERQGQRRGSAPGGLTEAQTRLLLEVRAACVWGGVRQSAYFFGCFELGEKIVCLKTGRKE